MSIKTWFKTRIVWRIKRMRCKDPNKLDTVVSSDPYTCINSIVEEVDYDWFSPTSHGITVHTREDNEVIVSVS